MKKRHRIYISLPISGRPLEAAREDADRTAAWLSRRGYEAVNPFDIYAGREPSYHDHLAADIRALLDCDGIVMLPGWARSFGCRLEYGVAAEMMLWRRKTGEAGFRIFQGLREVPLPEDFYSR